MIESKETSYTVTDIADAVKVIDYAAEQGVFKGWQIIRPILQIRDLLNAFVTTSTAEEPTECTVANVADAVKIIDYAADQGAFKSWQIIRPILQVRDRLHAFVTAATAEVNTEASVLKSEAGMPAQ